MGEKGKNEENWEGKWKEMGKKQRRWGGNGDKSEGNLGENGRKGKE